MLSRYLGKIQALISQEGFFSALKKTLKVLAMLLRPVQAGDVLFISSGLVGASSYYRVHNVSEELELHGIKCAAVIQEYPFLLSCVDKFQVFIFHKVSHTLQIQEFVKKIKEKNKEIIFETDDLMFDAQFLASQNFLENSNKLEKKFFAGGVGQEFIQDTYVKTCTTTTSFLAEKMRAHGKRVFVVPNKLSAEDLKISAKIVEAKKLTKLKANEAVRIGYFSGTRSHDKDFATVVPALLRLMEKYKNVELVLVGPLDIENKLNKFSSRIKQLPFVSREKHFENVASVNINIVPLEIGNPFCESRSELKFFEAGIVKVSTVAVDNQTFREAIADGVDGFVANGDEEWFSKLEKLILDENLRKEMGEKAYQTALEKYSIQNSQNEEYYEYLKNKIQGS